MRRLVAFVGIALLGVLLVASGGQGTTRESKVDLKRLKEEIAVFGSVINESLAQSFGAPFGYLDKARGAYLPGYGAVFTFEVNLTPLQFASPFASPPSPEQERKRREEETRRRERARTVAERVLADFGHTLSQLHAEESIAIIIHTVSVQEQGIERAAIVVHIKKQLINDFRNSSIDRATFLQKLRVVEY